ncbi:hypothetical protein [Sphingobium yanoikuyae]|jgi:hypothetical protein|uniref:hypothetical protein n=1 Tax=Sphingobium yanoikuyae TaxID=13690 RepID=UPI0035C7B787
MIEQTFSALADDLIGNLFGSPAILRRETAPTFDPVTDKKVPGAVVQLPIMMVDKPVESTDEAGRKIMLSGALIRGATPEIGDIIQVGARRLAITQTRAVMLKSTTIVSEVVVKG